MYKDWLGKAFSSYRLHKSKTTSTLDWHTERPTYWLTYQLTCAKQYVPSFFQGDIKSRSYLYRYTPDKYTDDDKDKDSDTAQKLPSFIDVMGFDDNLSNKILEAVTKESKEEEESESDKLSTTVFGQLEESVNSILMEYILRGRIPDTCNLLNFGKMIMQGRSEELDSLDYLKVKDHMKVDAVVMIISRSSKTLPKKLIKSVRQETKKKDIGMHLLVHVIVFQLGASSFWPDNLWLIESVFILGHNFP